MLGIARDTGVDRNWLQKIVTRLGGLLLVRGVGLRALCERKAVIRVIDDLL
jgi:hypothetical protein